MTVMYKDISQQVKNRGYIDVTDIKHLTVEQSCIFLFISNMLDKHEEEHYILLIVVFKHT